MNVKKKQYKYKLGCFTSIVKFFLRGFVCLSGSHSISLNGPMYNIPVEHSDE